jgi:hypothetical protein
MLGTPMNGIRYRLAFSLAVLSVVIGKLARKIEPKLS